MSSWTDWLAAAFGNAGPEQIANIAQSGPVTSAVSTLSFLGQVTDPKLWASVGWVILGCLLILLGLVLWAKTYATKSIGGLLRGGT